MALALALAAAQAFAIEVRLLGTFGDKAAVLSIDGGEPKTVKVGQRHGGVGVIAVGDDGTTIEVEGRRRVIRRGQHFSSAAAKDARQSVVLVADGRGHFVTEGRVNGGLVRFVVDTGATSIVLPAPDANRLGIDYRKGQRGLIQTANGVAGAWRVSLDQVRLGAIELHQVDAVVIEKGPDVVLLGMSFLNRVEMRRDGDTMTLTRRF
jgi:aspartyl protease family protein